MVQTISVYQFRDAFRECRPNNFSYEGLTALFDYLEEYEESTGENIEFDVIGLCCDYTEYDNLEEFQKDYDAEDYETMEDIENATMVIYVENSDKFIIAQF